MFRPLDIIGPDSGRSGEGAYCANEQNKFTEYHDAVFEYMWINFYKSGDYGKEFEDILTLEKLTSLSADAGLDKDAMSDCLKSGKYALQIEEVVKQGRTAGISGTPTFFVGEQKVQGPQPFNIFKTLIDIQLKS